MISRSTRNGLYYTQHQGGLGVVTINVLYNDDETSAHAFRYNNTNNNKTSMQMARIFLKPLIFLTSVRLIKYRNISFRQLPTHDIMDM